jgi:Fe2+ or Zn2+ uptake regulation protein
LDILAVQGQIMQLSLDPQGMRYDGNPIPHGHLRCQQCGKIIDFDCAPLAEPLKETAAGHDFIAQDIRFDIQGACQKCAATKSNKD